MSLQPKLSETQPVNVDLAGIRFPDTDECPDQDEETCQIQIDGEWRRIRFHDYHEVYKIPGLYETIFYRSLKCSSPERVGGLLAQSLADMHEDPRKLRVLDVGAGNGMVGEELRRRLDVQSVVGADIIPEAQFSAERDRPWVYDDYLTCDLGNLSTEEERRLRDARLNALVSVAALGYGDLPAHPFCRSLDVLETPAWLAFNIKEDFLKEHHDSGFSDLIRDLSREEVIQIQAYQRYCHRLGIAGQPLYYVAMVAVKQQELPDKYLT